MKANERKSQRDTLLKTLPNPSPSQKTNGVGGAGGPFSRISHYLAINSTCVQEGAPVNYERAGQDVSVLSADFSPDEQSGS